MSDPVDEICADKGTGGGALVVSTLNVITACDVNDEGGVPPFFNHPFPKSSTLTVMVSGGYVAPVLSLFKTNIARICDNNEFTIPNGPCNVIIRD